MLVLVQVILTLWVSWARGLVKPCDFPEIKHGHLHGEDRHRQSFPVSVGTWFYYYCDENYVTATGRSQDYITCKKDGWSPKLPCRRKCIFNYLENGHRPQSPQKYLQGQSVKVNCYRGYTLPDKQTSLTCTENGWLPPPRCTRVAKCLKSKVKIENGFISDSQSVYFGNQEAKYQCNKDYVTEDRHTSGHITCLQKGWSTQPRCIKIKCDPPRIENGQYVPKRTNYKLRDTITYYCKSGFFPSSWGNTAKCTDKGWEPRPRCSLNPCEYPQIKHGALYSEESYKSYFPAPIGQWFHYSCDENYVTPNEKFWYYITCTNDGWIPEVPCRRKCIFNYSEHPHSPPTEQSYLQGQSLNVACPRGYSLPDQNTVTCTENGWSSPPTCIRHCDMPIFENAIAIFTGKPFKPNDTMDYQCLDGYENRDGSTNGSMECGEDGWSHLPTCFKSADKCGPPPEISNGDITSEPLEVYLSGSRVEYQCHDYHQLQGPTYVTCSYGKWSKPPRCIDPCVISESIMNENNIRFKGRDDKTFYVKTGESVEFVCKSGYEAVTSEESFQAMCVEGTVEFPRCE